MPPWLEVLDEEEQQFLKRFVLCSGSLKALCDEYGVSYPTLRARLDRLIAKVKAGEGPKVADSFQRKLHVLVADGKISAARTASPEESRPAILSIGDALLSNLIC